MYDSSLRLFALSHTLVLAGVHHVVGIRGKCVTGPSSDRSRAAVDGIRLGRGDGGEEENAAPIHEDIEHRVLVGISLAAGVLATRDQIRVGWRLGEAICRDVGADLSPRHGAKARKLREDFFGGEMTGGGSIGRLRDAGLADGRLNQDVGERELRGRPSQ